MLLLLLIFCFCTHTAEGYNYTCLKCTESPRPYTCQTIQHCGSHELCHLEEYVTTIGSRRFNLGCMDEMVCAISQVIGRKRADAGCSQCCHGDLCNVKGCGQELHISDGPVCYSCDSSLGTDGCEKVQQCGRDEVCQITAQIQFSGLGEKFYSTGCVHKQDASCQLSGKGGCRYCCDSNLCNAVDPCFSRLNSTNPSTYTTASTTPNITSTQTAIITKTKTGTMTAATTPYITSTKYSTITSGTTIAATTTNSASLSTILYNGPCIDESPVVCAYDTICRHHSMRCPKLCKLCV
ncbi:uncharacterized protein LOC128242071 [Mya arenaria]|uniref:uncharacterized protein LOC128242071 n=1 Tax=Mya arenaria TaxID=6604 RepID=UPI0022E06C47|nr:uncharacterized protein LOC128242071 [Mya arenaria]